MAGGRGTRLNNKVEKPLYNFNGKPLIDHVIENLQKSKVDKIIIALSPHTNQTLKHLKEKGFKNFNLNLLDSYNEFILNTPGEGYLKDYNYILGLLEKHSKKDTVLFINTDLPFINYNILNKVLNEYLKIQTDALSVFVPEEIFNT
ncbi:NTP transferase domain-containing protein, partial [Methanobrevibacter sp. UBA337]